MIDLTDREALNHIFATQNIRFLAIFSCGQCDRKKCDQCMPKTVISHKFEIFNLGVDRHD